jgi:single-stranded DNA-binding protein
MNRAIFIGTLTRPPTFRQTARGTPVCTFDLQVDEPDRHQNAWAIRVVIWGKQAKPAVRDLGHESVVLVAGYLRQWERVNREGQKLRSLEVVCEHIVFLSEPAGRTTEIDHAFIDTPAIQPGADPPAQVDESDPPAPDE